MPAVFIKNSNQASTPVAGQVLGGVNQDVFVRKLIVGNPVNSGNIGIYDITNPQPNFSANNDANLAFKYTFEASVGGTSTRVIDFSTNGAQSGEQGESSQGLMLRSGGNVMCDQNMQITVIYDVAA